MGMCAMQSGTLTAPIEVQVHAACLHAKHTEPGDKQHWSGKIFHPPTIANETARWKNKGIFAGTNC